MCLYVTFPSAFSCSRLASGEAGGELSDSKEADSRRTLSTSAPASTNCLLGNFEVSKGVYTYM